MNERRYVDTLAVVIEMLSRMESNLFKVKVQISYNRDDDECGWQQKEGRV